MTQTACDIQSSWLVNRALAGRSHIPVNNCKSTPAGLRSWSANEQPGVTAMMLKKLFLGTTALMAAGLLGAGAKAADPIRLTLGGFYGAALGGEIGGADNKG